MPPLTRQRTLESLLSWWSDSNRPGATISLHAAAKPLMKFMYHRDVLDLIKRQRDVPLSGETTQIYCRYLGWKYVSEPSKIAILGELDTRAQIESERRAIVDSPVPFDALLESPNAKIRQHTCVLLGHLASTMEGGLETLPCVQLVAILRETDTFIVEGAMYALSQIANSADGASAVVGARALDFVAELFESPNLKVRRYACSMLSNLASEESSREAVLGSVAGLVGTIRDAVTDAVDAGAFDSLLLLFESANEEVRRCACALLGRFAVHRFTAGASLNTAQCVRVVAFLRDTDTLVVEGAIYALSQIANSSDGAGAVVAAAALDYLPALFQSPNTQVWRYTSWMLGNLANDKSAREAVLASTSRLVSPLSDNVVNLVDARALDSIFVLLESPNKEVRRTSCSLLGRLAVHQSTAGAALTTRGVVTLLQIYALSQIANNSDGANAVVGARALDFVVALFDTRAQADASSKLSNLADDESTREEVVPCQQLATLLRDHDLVVVQNAIYSLSHIVRSPDGAQTVVDAKVLDFAPELLESSHKLVQLYTCRMLGRLATHSSTLDAVLCAKPCARLAALLCHNIVGEGAIYALSHISADLNGAKAVIDAGALNFVHKLFDSPSNEIRERAHLMVGNLVQYGSAKACVCFAALLREHNMSVIKNSISVLAKIAREPDGAKAVVDAKVLDIVPELLETPNDQVRQFTCNMLGRLVKHKSTLEAVLSANLCIRLIAVLYHDDLFIAWEAMQTLSTIANDLAGAEAVVDAKVLDFIPNLIESPDKLGGNRFTCDMLCRLARHKSTLGAVLSAQPFAWLTTFLYDDENVVVKRATEALAIIADDPTGAQAVVDAKALNVVPKLLESPNAQVRQSTCNMLSRLAKHESTLDAVLSEKLCFRRLIALLHDKDISVVKRATEALAIIADDPTGAKALVDAKVLDFVPELLQLPNVGVRRFTCNMMSRLARKESTLDAVLSEKLYFQRLVALLRDEDISVVERTTEALAIIADDPTGAQAVVDAKALNVVPKLLESPNAQVRQSTCNMLSRLAMHESTLDAVLSEKLCFRRLIALLHNDDIIVVEKAVEALAIIANDPPGAKAAVDAKLLNFVPYLLKSPNDKVRRLTSNMLRRLAEHSFPLDAVLYTKPFTQLISLFHDEDISVVEAAMQVLATATINPIGAKGVVDPSLLKTQNDGVRRLTSNMRGRLAQHTFPLDAVLCTKPFTQLISLLHDDDISVLEGVMHVLVIISDDPAGAQALVDAKALDFFPDLLKSPHAQVRKYTSIVLVNLVHESTLDVVLAAVPCVHLVTLLRDSHVIAVGQNAIYALSQIARSPAGAKAVVGAKALELVPELLQSRNDQVRQFTCNMLGRLAKHKSTLDVVLSINLCMRRLVALLYDDDAFVVEKAIQAIATVARYPAGAKAVVGAKALEVVPKLLQSRNNQVRQFTCNMLSRLVKYKFTLDAVLSINLCIRRLIDLLYDDNTLAAEQAMQAIATIASYPAGAKAVVGAKTLEFVPELLQSPYQPLLRRQTCYMLGNLADHEYTLDAVLASVHCIRCLVRHLVSLLRNDISLVVEGAIYALSKLAKERNAAKAIVRAGVLNFVAELTELDSTNTAIQTYTCLMLCRLARCPPLHLSI